MSIEPQAGSPLAPGPLIELGGVTQRYGTFRPVLLDLDLTVTRGEFVLVCGPGASGKSALVRLLAGLEVPASGSVRIGGEELAKMKPRARAQLRRSMGILPAGEVLLRRRSVLENVALAAWVAGAARAEGIRRAQAALTLVGLDVERDAPAPCGQLAGSERRAVALARALVNRPALLLLDDLLDSFDAASSQRLLAVIEQFCLAGVTAIATHRERPAGPEGSAAAKAGPAWPSRLRRLWLREGRLSA